ncbi:MAG: hypothetical protein ACOX37_12150 [Bacillota bacterium]
MSGGVDSSIAAYLLKKQGYQVTGVTMQIWPDDDSPAQRRSGLLFLISHRRCQAGCRQAGYSSLCVKFQASFFSKSNRLFCQGVLKGTYP